MDALTDSNPFAEFVRGVVPKLFPQALGFLGIGCPETYWEDSHFHLGGAVLSDAISPVQHQVAVMNPDDIVHSLRSRPCNKCSVPAGCKA